MKWHFASSSDEFSNETGGTRFNVPTNELEDFSDEFWDAAERVYEYIKEYYTCAGYSIEWIVPPPDFYGSRCLSFGLETIGGDLLNVRFLLQLSELLLQIEPEYQIYLQVNYESLFNYIMIRRTDIFVYLPPALANAIRLEVASL